MVEIQWSVSAFNELQALGAALTGDAALANDTLRRLVSAPDALLLQPRQGQRLKAYPGREIRRLRVGQHVLDYALERTLITILHLGADPEAPPSE